MGFSEECCVPHHWNPYGEDNHLDIVIALLCMGLYPNVCVHQGKRKVLFFTYLYKLVECWLVCVVRYNKSVIININYIIIIIIMFFLYFLSLLFDVRFTLNISSENIFFLISFWSITCGTDCNVIFRIKLQTSTRSKEISSNRHTKQHMPLKRLM